MTFSAADDGDRGSGAEPPARNGQLDSRTTIFRRFTLAVENLTVIVCLPAANVSGTLIVFQVCEPPVFGTVTVLDVELGAPATICNDPPPTDATLK